jgi:tetratricopeptide (TPR) repeat protein
MGLWSWLFPTPEQRLQAARRDLERGRFADARDAAQSLDHPDAAEVVRLAELGLCRLNMAAVESWLEAGDDAKVAQHLELAREFHQPECAEELAALRVRIRETAQERREDAARRAAVDATRSFEVDPRFHQRHAVDALPLPPGVSEEDAEALQARLTILFESYPEALRPGMLRMGAAFSQAVIDLEDGQVDAAWDALVALPEDEPLALYERARAALALRKPAIAVDLLTRFAALAQGHQAVGTGHSGALLARAQAEAGDLPAAIATLTDARRADPDLAAGLYASLLEHAGRLDAAETVLRGLLKKAGNQPWIYNAIARVRVRDGRRLDAMSALERALQTCGCGPGSCGSAKPDVETYRLLATLYLEDGRDVPRALELADTARSLVEQPSWDDLYLAALASRARAEPDVARMVELLQQVTPSDHPRRAAIDALAS